MKNLVLTIAIILVFASCRSNTSAIATSQEEVVLKESDTVRIANDEVEYEIIIIEPGFNNWLMARAKPQGYYTQEFLESRNKVYVTEWNNRVLDPARFDQNLYQLQIDYNSHIDYGYEVNYKLYYYFIYFQRTYGQRLSGFVPRI